MKIVTISLKEPTRTRLKGFGVFGESYDDLINRLLDENEKYSTEFKWWEHNKEELKNYSAGTTAP